jgi:hypothetical protein
MLPNQLILSLKEFMSSFMRVKGLYKALML